MFIGKYKSPTVIAEIGCSHIGDLERARKLIKLAHLAGADYAKLQKRNPIESTPVDLQNKPHPNQIFAYGNTYLEHRLALELNIEQHAELKKYCESIDIGYSTSVWDVTSAKEVIGLNPDFIKVPSACNTNFELLDCLYGNYNGQVHISLGMVTGSEKDQIFSYIKKHAKRTVLYHCTSEYPCPAERLYLLEINQLCSMGCEVGFSNHGYGISSDIAATVLGATWIERHFIDDRCFRHSDASASLEPQGLEKLCRDLKSIHKALNYKFNLSDDELAQRSKLKYFSGSTSQ